MPALAFDTHAYVKKLREAGVPEAQAEIQVEAIAAVIESRMATKDDLQLQKVEIERSIKELDVKLEREIAEVRRDIKELDVKLETRLKEMEMRLLIRLGGLLVVGIGAIATLIKLL